MLMMKIYIQSNPNFLRSYSGITCCKCLKKFNEPQKKVKPSGAQKQTWIRCVSKDLESRGVEFQDATRLAQDRSDWRSMVKGV